MLPPSGLEPSLALLFEDVTSTGIVASSIATATSLLPSSMAASSSTIIAAIASATATVIAEATKGEGHKDGPKAPPSHNECSLLGPFAIIVQGALGLCALLALVFKRWKELPQRPVKIWIFDVSKQVVGSVLVHIANLLMSMLSSGQFNLKVDAATVAVQMRGVDENGIYQPNPCSFYLLNLAIDTTIGIPILIFLLRILTALFAQTPLGNPRESIESGNYGNPPRAWWWVKQSLIYFLGLMGMKLCVLIIFLALPWISRVGDWALRWTEGDEALQVIFVMLVFPVIMNATQYYIIDSFIKKQTVEHAHERIPDDEEEPSQHWEGPDSGSSDSIHSEDEEDAEILAKANKTNKSAVAGSVKPVRGQRSLQIGSKDYDPMFDGENSPTLVGSANNVDNLLDDDEDRGKKPT